jgi:hypothetical protein
MEWQACTGNREISKGIFVGEKYLNKVQIWEWYLAQIFPYKYTRLLMLVCKYIQVV